MRERDVASGLFPHVTWTERTHPKGGEVFVLPPSWSSGSVTLEAELREPLRFIGHGAAECVEAGCQANNRFRMTGIPFVSTGYIDLATVRMWFRGELARCAAEEPSESAARRCPAPWKALAKPAQLLPLQENGYNFDPVSYYGSVEITDLKKEYTKEDRSREAKYRLDDYADDQPRGCSSRRFCADQLFGVYGPKYSTGGHSRGRLATPMPGGGWIIDQPFAVASWKSAQTHELSHGLGRAHADTVCGGDSDGETGEEWPPDNRGTMDGVGYDIRTGKVIAPRALGAFGSSNPKAPDYQPARWYDYMSYCRKDDDDSGAWTSVRGWEKNVDLLRQIAAALGRDGADAPRAASAARTAASGSAAPLEAATAATSRVARSAAASVLRVRATVLGHGTSAGITSVKPRTGEVSGGPVDAGYAIVARNAAGGVLSRVAPQVSHEHGHPGEHTESIVADIPAAGVARVELVGADGAVLASRAASAAGGAGARARPAGRAAGRRQRRRARPLARDRPRRRPPARQGRLLRRRRPHLAADPHRPRRLERAAAERAAGCLATGAYSRAGQRRLPRDRGTVGPLPRGRPQAERADHEPGRRSRCGRRRRGVLRRRCLRRPAPPARRQAPAVVRRSPADRQRARHQRHRACGPAATSSGSSPATGWVAARPRRCACECGP